MNAIVVSHNGMGDNFHMIGALNYLSTFYKKVYLLCKDKYYKNVSLFFDENSNISCIPFDSKNEIISIMNIINNKFTDKKNDIFVCGGHKRYLNKFKRVKNNLLINDIELHKNEKILYNINCSQINNNNYKFIIDFYYDMNLNLNHYFKYYKIPSVNEAHILYEQIKQFNIVFIQLKSSCGKSLNIENLKTRCLNDDNTIIICNDINVYPNDEKYKIKKQLAEKFVYNKIINYVEIIKNAKEIYLVDSCFIGLVLPLFKTNNLKVDKDKLQIILRNNVNNSIIL